MLLNTMRGVCGQNFPCRLCDDVRVRHVGALCSLNFLDLGCENLEARRLTNSQLILGLRRIRNNGTFIIFLHKAESWHALLLLNRFCRFSDVQLFKPRKRHATRSCFYLVAKNVKPLCREVQAALTAWKEGWKNATLMDPTPADPEPVAAQVTSVLAEFGDQFIKLATPVWEIQRPALEKAPWLEA